MANDALAVRLLAIFTDELDEQVQQMNDDLLALERAPGDADRLRSVFRVMHTLKGASRSAGLPVVEELCHALESELSRVRDGGASLGGAQIALLFAAADALGETRDALRLGAPLPEGPLADVLHLARGRATAPPRRAQAPHPPTPAPAIEVPTPPLPEVMEPVRTAPAPSVERTEDVARTGGHVRVSLQQVDAIAGAAGEIAGLAAVLDDRAAAISSIRASWRREGARSAASDVMDRELTRLVRQSGEDARVLSAVSGRLGASARHLRQRPLSELTETLPRVARDVAKDVGKEVRLLVTGGEIEADRVVLEALREPLLHLVRNAVDHGLEVAAAREKAGKHPEGEVRIAGALRGDRLVVAVSDDGRGLDLDAVRRGLERRGKPVPVDPAALADTVFDDGFTTRDVATSLSGRGVGMGIVRAAAERLGGTVSIGSVPGRSTTITIDVPISIATMNVVLVQAGGVIVGVPSAFVVRVARADARKLARVDGHPMLVTAERPIPVTTLAALLGPPFEDTPSTSTMLQIVVLENGGRLLAVVVDDLVDERELVLRPLEHAGYAATNATVGTALLSTGVIALVLSVPALLSRGEGRVDSSQVLHAAAIEARPPARILVVDDSITSRTLEQSVLSAAGYEVITAVDGEEAWRTMQQVDVALVVSDVEMPNLDGFSLCERIRADKRTATLPVILVTSLDEVAQRTRGLAAGADAYIGKSGFDQDVLLDTVRMLLGRDVT